MTTKNNKKEDVMGIILYCIVFTFSIIGWSKTIYNLIHCDFEAPYTCEKTNGFGVTTGLGAIIGRFNVRDL